MDNSSSVQWQYADPRQRQSRPSNSQPSFWQQAQNLPQVGARHGHRAYQPTVEDAIDDSGMYYGSTNAAVHGRHPSLPDPYSWARNNSGAQLDKPLNSVRATTVMASRRSFVEPHASFSPPSLVADSSTLSSASSNFSVPTPTFDSQPRRRSSQQAFSDQIDRDALARANKRMASGMCPPIIYPQLSSQLAVVDQLEPAGHFSGLRANTNLPVAPGWPNLSDSPFHTDRYDPFAPLQPRAPFATGTGLYANQGDLSQPFSVRRESDPSTYTSHRRHSQVQQQIPPALSPADDASAFKSHLNSELNRRKVADKTVSTIRSERARAVAQAKENARRTDWAKEVLLKFPIQCALAESLRPEDMMASITKAGVFELTASMV